MWKVENLGKRAFIATPLDILKGAVLSDDKKHAVIIPGATVEVTDGYGKILSQYKEIRIIKKPKDKA